MDFFDSQDVARRNTGWLVFLYAVAVVTIYAITYLVCLVALRPSAGADPGLALLVAFSTTLVIGGGTLYKIGQLRAGGSVIAERLGGRVLGLETKDPAERRLLNVVEEMAIASGTAVPLVYLLPDESGINAFAAGFSPEDAVIGVTLGAVQSLSREELSGVIAHEFSHILNGDMLLNLRLVGILHGILVVGLIGRFLLRSMGRSRRSRRGKGGGTVLLLGVGLWLVGWAGTICGNLIKAAVSRQREYLADASAVQFTRNPRGIAGALKKIGGLARGSRIAHANAAEASHLYFGQGVATGWLGLYATHPPLVERIRRIDPAWDGEYPTAATVLEQIGRPTPAHVEQAALLLAEIPSAVRAAVHEPYGARAVIYALLIEAEPIRSVQLAHLADRADPGVHAETLRLLPAADALPPRSRLPLIDAALPTLRRLSPSQRRAFHEHVAALARADETVDIFEWALLRILRHRLLSPRPARVRHHRTQDVRSECVLLLSVLAHHGHRDDAGAARAFEAAVRNLRFHRAEMIPRGPLSARDLDRAVDTLAEAAPHLKRSILRACALCIETDREITGAEAELFRALGDSLGCPVPPPLPGQSLA